MTEPGTRNSLETDKESVDTKKLSPIEMYRELLELGYLTPADEDTHFIEPSAYKYFPNITIPHSTMIEID